MSWRFGAAKIGIFWVHNQVVLGCSVEPNDKNIVEGIIDSHFDHTTEWENNSRFVYVNTALMYQDYSGVPRGRVLYSIRLNAFIVYMDKTLHKKYIKTLIAAYFGIAHETVLWKMDEHYRVLPNLTDFNKEDCI